MATSNYKGKKFCKGKIREVVDALTAEEALQIKINEEAFTVTMRTPGNDLELIRGLLYSEDVYKDLDSSIDAIVKKENDSGIITIVNLNIPENKIGKGYLNSRSFLSVSSCGICGKQELEDISGEGKSLKVKDGLDVELLSGMFEEMNSKQKTFLESGGSHAASAFTLDGKCLSIMEDIGRHNAVDKVVGELIEQKTLKHAFCLTISGRISYEIIIKAFRAKIPVLAAVSAPSSLAVDYARELGITLLGFCRDGKATCYSHSERVVG